MNPDSPARLSNASADLDELDSESADLCPLKFGAFKMPSHQEKQTVRKHMQIEPELIGKKPVATEPISFEFELKFLDPVFDIPPQHVDLMIDPLGIEAQIRDHKPLIRSLVHVFGLGNHSAPASPRVSPIAEGTKEPLLLSGLMELGLGFG